MDHSVIKQISLTRHLYKLGLASLESANDLYLFSAINLFQDAVEAFLLAVANFAGVNLNPNTNFDQYFVLIDKEINPERLPIKNELLRLNKIRVASKHHGIQPARGECQRLALLVREFFEQVSNSVLKVNFATVSAIDLLGDGETKDLLLEAKTALDNGNNEQCAISCRKAIYLELEHRYDISHFKDKPPDMFYRLYCQAPSYACNKEYIEKHVFDPTDYIVYDRTDFDRELLILSVDIISFWNVWRLTPKVYRTKDKCWIVKHEFDKLNEENLKDNIEYIFNTTIDIILSICIKQKSIKRTSGKIYILELKEEEVPVYKKADVTSEIVARTPKGVTKLVCNYHVNGIQGDGPYWYTYVIDPNLYIHGFVHNDYMKSLIEKDK